MRIEVIRTTGGFDKQYKKLPKQIKEAAKEKESLFRTNPFDQRLATHKLHGKEKSIWAFSVTQSYRIKFAFLAKNHVLFLEIGTHAIYQ